MNSRELKQKVAQAALAWIPEDEIIGMGTGSTVDCLIEMLPVNQRDFKGMVASSERTAAALRKKGIQVLELNDVGALSLYIDGADEATQHGYLIKGGGGALTREKVIAAASRQFVCMVDESKWVGRLGVFPLPIEVIPMARSFVARQIMKMGGQPTWRAPLLTDNGNMILDVTGLDLSDPPSMERALNQIPGVVTVGLFMLKKPDRILIARPDRVESVCFE